MELPTANVEGIAFVPDFEDGIEGNLYVAGNKPPLDSDGATSGIIDVYRVPSRTLQTDNGGDVVALSRSQLNNNLLNNGLVDSKIGALNYFEGVLYILHDNAQVVRAWDIKEGKMLSEWALPSVQEGLDRQWEGLAFERIGAASQRRRDLRTLQSPPLSLMLHLTLDSPPQVWSLAVREGATKGAIVLPDCAA